MSPGQELAGRLGELNEDVEEYQRRLSLALMLLGKISEEIDGVRPEDPLNLDAIAFFLDEATRRVRSVQTTIHTVGNGLTGAQAYLDGCSSGVRTAAGKAGAR